ncbi:hypothetical protein [Shewanella sp. KX20019]|uniref:hypothetical protein n=1 Tax=Shewanella sp. KX20019 TaxID=2803864 RepID=UPI001F373549|nr:hypothetical protein [Shewanella sp. KX20019]
MEKWFTYIDGVWRFRFDAEAYLASHEAAEQCSFFLEDDEDEQIDDHLRSCYNCLYRRWRPKGFDCYRKCYIAKE